MPYRQECLCPALPGVRVVAEVLTVHDQHAQPERFGEAFWNERYSCTDALWSGNPNRYLVREASGLPPGTALDVGCGEGADVLWLAGRGWRVTGVNLSTVALGRAARHAAEAGPGIAARVDWVHADLIGWDPGAARYDLVSSQYIHLPPRERARRCCAASRTRWRPAARCSSSGITPLTFRPRCPARRCPSCSSPVRTSRRCSTPVAGRSSRTRRRNVPPLIRTGVPS